MSTFTGNIDRALSRQYGEEAVSIIKCGAYSSPSGNLVVITDRVREAVDRTVSYPPDTTIPRKPHQSVDTQIEVENETTLSAARRLIAAGHNPVALNFASATTPGGGFLSGERAQEEYLARSSSLYACLLDNEMYGYHRDHWSAFYSDYAIYSPDVPVFRDDDGALLEAPYQLSIITSAAVNASKGPPEEQPRIDDVMASRIDTVLAIGQSQGHDAIVLGAWGCGAFGNDPAKIAGLFHDALTGPYADAYRHVVFAIVDWSQEEKFIGPFAHAFDLG